MLWLHHRVPIHYLVFNLVFCADVPVYDRVSYIKCRIIFVYGVFQHYRCLRGCSSELNFEIGLVCVYWHEITLNKCSRDCNEFLVVHVWSTFLVDCSYVIWLLFQRLFQIFWINAYKINFGKLQCLKFKLVLVQMMIFENPGWYEYQRVYSEIKVPPTISTSTHGLICRFPPTIPQQLQQINVQ